MEKKRIAIITARGGSKRIPGKNIRDFCGKPMIAYSIEAALKSNLFAEAMVSTDSMEIAGIAKKYGAKVPFFRSEKNSGDYATTSDVILEVLNQYKEMGQEFDYVCCIYPTAPFLTSERLREAMGIMEANHPAGVMPVVAFSYPPQRCLVLNGDGHLEYKYREYVRVRSQDLETQYHDAGQFYIYESREYVRRGGIITEGIMPVVLSDLEVQDIDHEEDWKLAELKYRLLFTS